MENTIKYSAVTDEIVALLSDIVGDKNIVIGDGLENYARDESPGNKSCLPEIVVKPENTDSVARILKIANEHTIPITTRGGGTGLSGGAVPIARGIVISMEKMKRILEIDKENFVATVEAGVVLSDLLQAVTDQGLYYPIYPGEASASLGGNVATNAGGMKAVKYGVTRHFVLGLEAVLPGGEIIKTGGKYVKCSTAYDLTQLLIGSEGTLAVITKVLLRLLPPSGKSEVLFIPFHSLHNAIRTVPEILRRGILPIGIEFMEKDIVKMTEQYMGKDVPLDDYEAYLMMIVEGDNEENINHQIEQIVSICKENAAVDVFIPASERAKRNLIEFREKFYYALQKGGMLEFTDIVVPRSKIAEFVEIAHRIGENFGIQIIAVGHAGDGNVHVCLIGDANIQNGEKIKQLLTSLYQKGVSLGGTISGEHGLGLFKKDYLSLVADSDMINLMKRIKKAFDPNSIMNPGKIF